MIKNKEKINRIINNWGIMPFLLILEEFEEEGEYEKCQEIFEMIKEYSDKYELNLPTKYSEEFLTDFLSYFQDTTTKGQIALSNMPYYTEQVKEEIGK